jgi:hypothetical protein
MTECNNYNGDQLCMGGRRREDDSFPEKKIIFCFNRPRNLDADARSQGVESSKDFEIRSVLEKESRSTRRTSYQARSEWLFARSKNRKSRTEAPDQRLPRSQSPISGRQKS